MPNWAASLAAEPVPAVVPLEGLLAGGEPADGLLAGGEGAAGLLAGGEPAEAPPPDEVPPDGLLAGGEAVEPPPVDVPPDDAPLDGLPGDDALPLAPVVVDPFEDPAPPPPHAVSAAASAKARRSSRVLMWRVVCVKTWMRGPPRCRLPTAPRYRASAATSAALNAPAWIRKSWMRPLNGGCPQLRPRKVTWSPTWRGVSRMSSDFATSRPST